MIFTNGTIQLSRAETLDAIIVRDGDWCRVPGCKSPYEFTEANPRTIEHVTPRARGGVDDLRNLELAHQRCNNWKGDRIYIGVDEFGIRILEPLPYREPKNTVVKRPPTDCCNEGRDLLEDQVCEICGLNPQPESFPRWAKLAPKDCPHEGAFWCWACSIGIYERVPASVEAMVEYDGAEIHEP